MKNKNDLFYFFGAIGFLFFVIRLTRKKKMNELMIIKGSYQVPLNVPNRVDALHSFERRKSDGFGGYMATKIRAKMKEVYNKGINPDIKDIKIKVDSKNYKVDWQATISESTDGNAYLGISTVGSAGTGADDRAKGQIERMKTFVPGSKNYKLVLDFKNPKGIYIRQFFYKYSLGEFPPH
jgi:hypothetical protein